MRQQNSNYWIPERFSRPKINYGTKQLIPRNMSSKLNLGYKEMVISVFWVVRKSPVFNEDSYGIRLIFIAAQIKKRIILCVVLSSSVFQFY